MGLKMDLNEALGDQDHLNWKIVLLVLDFSNQTNIMVREVDTILEN